MKLTLSMDEVRAIIKKYAWPVIPNGEVKFIEQFRDGSGSDEMSDTWITVEVTTPPR